MHGLGLILLWAALQVTLIAVVVWGLHRLAVKSGPTWRGQVINGGFVLLLFVSALAVSPWPSWSGLWANHQESALAESTSPPIVPPPMAGSPSESTTVENPAPQDNANTNSKTSQELESPWAAAWFALTDTMKPTKPPAANTAPPERVVTLPVVLAWVFCVGVSFGTLRLLAGVWLLRREVARGAPLNDPTVQDLIQEIQQAIGHRSPIEVRVTHRLSTAATTSLFHPVVLLPASWTGWTDLELRAVLAHELNHVKRKDCFAALCAEVGKVIHFYHPLVHWLANRLRLEQELAADALAARLIGGQKRYLCILAELALAESSRLPLWPARAFLPSHRTFMRRIEMLKKDTLEEGRTSRLGRYVAVATLGLATLFAVGFRNQTPIAQAQDRESKAQSGQAETTPLVEQTNAAAKREPFPLTYVPADAVAVIGIRPKELLGQKSLEPLAKILLEIDPIAQEIGIPIKEVEQVTLSFGFGNVNDFVEPLLQGVMIRATSKLQLETLKKHLTPDAETGFYGGQLYVKQRGRGAAFWLADEYVLITSTSEVGLKQAIDARNLSANREERIPAWKAVANEPVAFYGNVAQMRKIQTSMNLGIHPGSPQASFRAMGINPMFGPLWSDVDTVVGSLKFGTGIDARVTTHSDTSEQAAKVKQTLEAMLVLGRNVVEQNQQMIGQLPESERQMIGSLLTLSQQVMKTLKVEQTENDVNVTAQLNAQATSAVLTALLPAVDAARDAARNAQGKNNLKQIGLAMHNYHETHSHFPPPVLIGPDFKTPHSWRVAILPFLDEAELFKQYRLNEPWDSEHNKTLLEKIPAVYRHPKDKPDSSSASYFALVGKGTLMGEKDSEGTRMREILDGTSNTLMIVEAKRDVPWTKPEDIAYNPDRSAAVPKLGGWFEDGFSAAFGDGAVRMIKGSVDKTMLQNLIERADNNPIDIDSTIPDSERRGRSAGRGGSSSKTPPPAVPVDPASSAPRFENQNTIQEP